MMIFSCPNFLCLCLFVHFTIFLSGLIFSFILSLVDPLAPLLLPTTSSIRPLIRRKEQEQLAALKQHHQEEIDHHKKEIERLQREIDRHKGKIRKLKHDDWNLSKKKKFQFSHRSRQIPLLSLMHALCHWASHECVGDCSVYAWKLLKLVIKWTLCPWHAVTQVIQLFPALLPFL